MILRRRAYIRILQPKTNQFSEKKSSIIVSPAKLMQKPKKKRGMRDGVKKEITPRGDGNVKMFSVNVTFIMVKKEIPP